jgi:Holliday junction DNA helicase RuvA
MIARIRGKLLEIALTEAVVDVNGVGYRIFIPMSTYDKMPLPGKDVELLTHMYVREDAIYLYGFASKEEKELFELLMSVSGIGAKLALSILSCMPVSSFCSAVSSGDLNSIKKINGVGKKTAERMLVELRDKVAKLSPETVMGGKVEAMPQEAEDAIMALEQLGVKRDKALKAVHKLLGDLPKEECSSENLIRKALQSINS